MQSSGSEATVAGFANAGMFMNVASTKRAKVRDEVWNAVSVFHGLNATHFKPEIAVASIETPLFIAQVTLFSITDFGSFPPVISPLLFRCVSL